MDIVFATATVIVAHPDNGTSVAIGHGQHWPADDPIVRAYPMHFTDDSRFGLSSSRPFDDEGYPVGSRSSAAVETTTAAPGERRTRGRAR